MIVKPLDHYTPEIANRVRELLIQLSRSGKDKGEIPEDWFNDIINSPWHDLLVAEEDGKILGIASVSVTMGPGSRRRRRWQNPRHRIRFRHYGPWHPQERLPRRFRDRRRSSWQGCRHCHLECLRSLGQGKRLQELRVYLWPWP